MALSEKVNGNAASESTRLLDSSNDGMPRNAANQGKVRQSSTPHKRVNLPGNKSTLQMCIVVAGIGCYVELRMSGWWRTGTEGYMRPRASKEKRSVIPRKKIFGMCVWVRDTGSSHLSRRQSIAAVVVMVAADSILIVPNKGRAGDILKATSIHSQLSVWSLFTLAYGLSSSDNISECVPDCTIDPSSTTMIQVDARHVCSL
jgi:hypothetical protein